jgi:hypothetical protein
MARKRYVSGAYLDLSKRLERRGRSVSPRQVERMVAGGVLSRPEGGGMFSAEDEDRAIEIADLLEQRLQFDEVMAILFVRGWEVDLDRLRKAYLSIFERMLKLLKRTSPSHDPFDIAEGVGRRLAAKASRSDEGRAWRDRLKGREESARSLFQSINIVMLWTVLLGEFPYKEEPHRHEALRELVDGSGLSAAETDRIGALGPLTDSLPVDELGDVLDFFNFETLMETLAGASDSDLVECRDILVAVVGFCRSMTEYLTRVGNLSDAMGFGPMAAIALDEVTLAAVPWFLVLKSKVSGLAEPEHVSELKRMIPINEARVMLLDSIPEKFWHLMAAGEDALTGLSDSDASELAEALERFGAEHPETLELAMTE